MKKSLLLALLALPLSLFAQKEDPNMGIIPAPTSVHRTRGEFKLTPETLVLVDSPNHKAIKFFKDYLLKNNLATSVTDMAMIDPKKMPTKNVIVLSLNFKDNLPAEGYELHIDENRVEIKGHGAGMFYGMQSLIQLINKTSPGSATIPCGNIKDHPRFGYRGMHLDVARHFFDVAFVKKYIDVMAFYKLNTFHWHLTDDQGWRIEIKKYPKLTEIGSKRAQTKIGRAAGPTAIPDLYDNTPYGPYFYTQDQIREVVEYASSKFINVVPEIEMPSHALAALAAYPEMGCDPGKGYKVGETWGGFDDVFCPTDETFNMLYDILREVIDLFPGKYIHAGGDECNKVAWKKSEFCRQLIIDKQLKNEDGIQSYFMEKIEKFLNTRGVQMIGWDEILEGGLAPNAVVMSWRGEKGGIAAAQLNHDVIMTPASGGLYFDHAQSKSSQEPLSIGGFAPLEKVYNYEPVPSVLSKEQAKHVIGVQANLWTEYIATPSKAEYMLLPRMLALSESAWSDPKDKDYRNFSQSRVAHHLAVLDKMGYNYRVPTAVGASDTTMKGGKFKLELSSPVEGATVHYTIDGSEPSENDLVCSAPLEFTVPERGAITLKTIVITSSGKKSIVNTMKLEN
ncbi:MAG: family 20 glycosylhydrolase [Taibaiella sp.]|nr:family 20 glycosylhydrolase [Taibaiella sp.]